MPQKAVFIDRDNTLLDDPGYLTDPAGLKLLPGVELALKSLSQAGFKLIVVTNQSGIARGMMTIEQLQVIHETMRQMLADKGAHIDAIYYCPFHPDGTVAEFAVESDLRKPKPGMLLKASEQWQLDLASCWSGWKHQEFAIPTCMWRTAQIFRKVPRSRSRSGTRASGRSSTGGPARPPKLERVSAHPGCMTPVAIAVAA